MNPINKKDNKWSQYAVAVALNRQGIKNLKKSAKNNKKLSVLYINIIGKK